MKKFFYAGLILLLVAPGLTGCKVKKGCGCGSNLNHYQSPKKFRR